VLNCILGGMDLTGIYGVFHPTTSYTFFPATRGTFSIIDGILGHKENLNKYKKIEIISCVLSDCN
jgi:hypothetical protein